MNASRSLASALVVLGISAIAAFACKRSVGAPSGSANPIPPALTQSAAPLAVPPPLPPLSAGAMIEDERNTIGVFRDVAPAAVFVTQRHMVMDYWGGGAKEVPAGSGSGFVWDKEGHVVTNFHVIQGAEGQGSLTVTLQDQTSHVAKIRGVEPRKDIAVLKIDVPQDKLVPIRLQDPKTFRLEVGQKAIAIGNPFGLDHTLTVGVVSAIGRAVDGIGGVQIRDMVQTDAAINPGNSGGPLLDSAGRLIGMNTVIFSKSGTSAGVGFAVPASSIQRVVPQIIRTGRAEQVGIGINIDPQGMLERRAQVRGVLVLAVQAGGPADKAGLRGVKRTANGLVLGDLLVGVDTHAVNDYDDLYNALDSYQAGQKVTLKVRREGKLVDVPITLVTLQ